MLCAAAAGCRQASSALPQAVRQLAARPMLGSCCHLAVLLLLRQHSYPAGCTARPMLGSCCHLAVLLVLHQHSYPAGCTTVLASLLQATCAAASINCCSNGFLPQA